MPPPSVVKFIVRPAVFIVKFKKTAVGAVLGNISSLLITCHMLIEPFSVQPFVKRSTMIKDTIQNNLHASAVDFLYKVCKKLIARLKVLFIDHPLDIFARMGIILIPLLQALSAIFYDDSIMRIYIVIILAVVLMIGRRYKDRIQIQYFYPQILQVIQLVPDSLNISSIKIPDVHRLRQPLPVGNFVDTLSDINIFPLFHIVGSISVAEAICVNLVHDRALCPVRRLKARRDAK